MKRSKKTKNPNYDETLRVFREGHLLLKERELAEENRKKSDYTKGTLIAIGIVEGITYLWARNNLTGLEAGLLTYLFGLLTYFFVIASKKNAWEGESKWSGEEVGAGLAGAIIPFIVIFLMVEFVAMTYFDSNLRH